MELGGRLAVAILLLHVAKWSIAADHEAGTSASASQPSTSSQENSFGRELDAVNSYIIAFNPSYEPNEVIECLVRLIDNVERIYSELLGAVVTEPNDSLLRGRDRNKIKFLAKSLITASKSCSYESMDFLQRLIDRVGKDLFLHTYSQRLIYSCLSAIVNEYFISITPTLNDFPDYIFNIMRGLAYEHRLEKLDFNVDDDSDHDSDNSEGGSKPKDDNLRKATAKAKRERLKASLWDDLDLRQVPFDRRDLRPFAELIIGLFKKAVLQNNSNLSKSSREAKMEYLWKFFDRNFISPCGVLINACSKLPDNFNQYIGSKEIYDQFYLRIVRSNPSLDFRFQSLVKCQEIHSVLLELWNELSGLIG